MSLESRLAALAARVADEFNIIRTEIPAGAPLGIGTWTVDTGQNANQVAATLTITEDTIAGTGLSTSGDTIVVGFDGWIRVDYGVVLNGVATRAAPELSITRAGGRLPGLTARHTYIRNSSGHTESSANASQLVEVSNGDVLTLTCRRLAGTATVTVQAESQVSIQRVA